MKKNKNIDNILFWYFVILIVITLIMGKLFNINMNIVYIIIIPISAFITNLLSSFIGKWLKYLFPILYGVCGIVIPMVVLNNSYNPNSLYYGLIPAISGFIVGTAMKMIRNIMWNRKYNNKKR